MALEGIQPTFKHVPPRLPLFSTHAVLSPSCAALMAATYPPGPPPTTTTSYFPPLGEEEKPLLEETAEESKAEEKEEGGKEQRASDEKEVDLLPPREYTGDGEAILLCPVVVLTPKEEGRNGEEASHRCEEVHRGTAV